MNIKGLGRKIFNGLPVVSFSEYLYNTNDNFFKACVKGAGHGLYGITPLILILGSTLSGTPNPLGWREALEERERQEYNQLYDKAVECVNTKLGFHPGTEQIELPRLTIKDLEKVVQSCESEGKLE